MATKVAMANDDRSGRQNWMSKIADNAVETWKEFRGFLGDVRAEMRKVVTPSRKEIETTTTVVLVAVAVFGLYFFLVDAVFTYGMHELLSKLGGLQK